MSLFRQQLLRLVVVLIAIGPAPLAAQSPDDRPKPVSFVRDIRPILSRSCFACHGPDDGQRKAKLRLDLKDGAFGEHDGGRPFVPKSLEESEAIRRITSNDPEERMPPGDDSKRLPPEQVELLKRWVREGATWESHWAFEKPEARPLPPVSSTGTVNPIDVFIRARLAAEHLTPSPEADRYTLARRVSLDLTGLPPEPEVVEAFVADRAPDAYESLVDRLLQSPAYGERWARVWLDLARYADTKGYEKDLKRTGWRYRDWVIEAFNADMPYGRFTVEQLAGDLLPGSTPEQRLATAFHRNTLNNDEGGTDDEEFRIAAVKDRVDSTMQIWMGLTIGCAKCHSHKYDPISHKEYYQFYAFFNQTEDSDKPDDRPTLPFPNLEQQGRIAKLRAEVARLEAQIHAPTPERLAAVERWERELRPGIAWSILKPARMDAASGSTMKALPDDSILVGGQGPARETYTLAFPNGPRRVGSIRLEAIPDPSLPQKGVGRSPNDGNFVLSGIDLSIRKKDGSTVPLVPASAEADFAQDNHPVTATLKSTNPKKQGWAVSPRQREPHQAVFRLPEAATIPEDAELVVRLDHQFEFAYPGFSLGRFRISTSEATDAPLRTALPAPIEAILAKPAANRSAGERDQLVRHYADSAPETKPARDEVTKLRGQVDAILNAVRTPVMKELAEGHKRETKIHRRGNFLDPGEKVDAAPPSAFPPLPKGTKADRLALAHWLLDPNNPLTARVAVNRHWAHFFGRGLVETQEDFGSQGQPPSHPELLDWLALDFQQNGWSFKHLCKRIVMSATYRQSSRVSPELAAKDRFNRLLARGPRFRLEAEMIRDATLAVSGLLSPKMFGPSVMPPQPDGIWKSTYNLDTWKTSTGDDRYRRGLYTFVKRTSPYPAMIAFDAPSRESCSVRRLNTNTPLQALVTLNDSAYIEGAQALARRTVREGGASPRDRVALALRLALIRPAEAREVEALATLYDRRLASYRADREAARALATDPLGPLPEGWDVAELAALTSVCNAILNLDEFLTRG